MRKLTTIAILLAITAAAAIVWIYRPFEDRRAIILIVADSLRPDRLSCYGYEGHHTPNIDRLANIGMLYTDAQAAGSWALPSVGAILTAQFPPQLGLVETPADPDLEWHEHRPQLSLAIPARTPTLPQLLAEAGFHTAAFVNQPVLTRDEGFMSGFDEWYFPLGNRRIRRYEARAVHSVLPKGPTHQDQTGMDRMMSDEFAAWITNNKHRKLFAWLHVLSAHPPFTPPKHHREAGDRSPSALYDAEVRYVDELVGRILRAVDSSVGMDNALVVLTSDHGVELGERGENRFGHSLHREVLWVPLIVSGSALTATAIDRTVSTVDITPTILDLAGVRPPVELTGRSLLSDGGGRAIYAEGMMVGSTQRALIDGGYKLIFNERGPKYELYDLRQDIDEQHDISTLESERVEELAATLHKMHAEYQALWEARFDVGAEAASQSAHPVPQLAVESDKVLVIQYPPWPGNTWRYRLPEYLTSASRPDSRTVAEPATGARSGPVRISGEVYSPGETPHGTYRIEATPQPNAVTLEMRVENTGPDAWDPEAVLCLLNISALDFNDFEGDRTRIVVGTELVPVGTLTGAPGDSLSLHRAHLLREQDAGRIRDDSRRYFEGSEIASASLITRSSQAGDRHIAVAWNNAWKVGYNLNQSFNCIHSEPRFHALKPGAALTVRGKIYFVDGSLDEVFKAFRNDFPKLGYGD